jgi:hypothetical protein
LLLQKAQEPQREEKLARVGKRIFVSHASKDKPLVEFFVEQVLRLGLEVATDDIFCTSLEGMGIRDGDDFREEIRLRLEGARLVLLVVTPNYKASEVCLNEMGAAWASNKPVIALAVEPIDYKSVGVFMEPTQIPKLSDAISLSNLKDRITKELGLPGTKTDLWDAKKKAFLSGLKAKVAECQFSTILSRREIDDIVAENRNLRTQLARASASQDGEAVVPAGIASNPDQVASEFSMDEMASFQVLKESAKKALEPFQPVVKAIILSNHTKHDYQPPQGFEGVLSSAIRKYVLIERDDGYQSNRKNTDVENAFTCLKKLEAFLQVTRSPTFHAVYNKKFQSEANIKSQAFWEEHFGFHVPA